MPPSFLPCGDRVMLRRLSENTLASDSPFVMPENSREKGQVCEVVAIPAQPYLTEYGVVILCPVQIGQRVIIGKYSGAEQKLEDVDGKKQEVLFVRWSEILAVELVPSAIHAKLSDADVAALSKPKPGKIQFHPHSAPRPDLDTDLPADRAADRAADQYAKEFAEQAGPKVPLVEQAPFRLVPRVKEGKK